jgi:hypothetical protein
MRVYGARNAISFKPPIMRRCQASNHGIGIVTSPPPHPDTRQRHRVPAQALVELALLLPVLVLLLALAADFGRAFTAYIAIGSAAREGAAYGMRSAAASTDTDGMRDAALSETPEVWGAAPTVSFPSCTDAIDADKYDCVAVQVSYEFTPILAVGPIGDSYTLTRTVRMRVIF